MTDLLIGCADLYDWPDIRPWVKSIKESGFSGQVYLICYRVTDLLRKKCEAYGVHLYDVEHTPYNTAIQHSIPGSPTVAHNYRMYHAWELMTRLQNEDLFYHGVDYVIMTDTSDVIFQRNPSEFLQNTKAKLNREFILCPSEGLLYEDEEWGKNNLIQGYGQISYDIFGRGKFGIANVGTIAGSVFEMHRLTYTIFSMTEGRYYPSDQSSFNILIQQDELSGASYITDHEHEPWAAQCGTMMDPTKPWLWERLMEPRPIWNNKKLLTIHEEPFYLVHQWNRVPELKKFYTEKYAD